MKTLCALGALSFVVLVTGVVVADSPGMGPEKSCNTHVDCPGCQQCVAGFCSGVEQTPKICMCHAECLAEGTSCELIDGKPLCGGTCVKAPPKRELACGADEDLVGVESLETPIADRDDAVTVMQGTPLVVTLVGGSAQ